MLEDHGQDHQRRTLFPQQQQVRRADPEFGLALQNRLHVVFARREGMISTSSPACR